MWLVVGQKTLLGLENTCDITRGYVACMGSGGEWGLLPYFFSRSAGVSGTENLSKIIEMDGRINGRHL